MQYTIQKCDICANSFLVIPCLGDNFKLVYTGAYTTLLNYLLLYTMLIIHYFVLGYIHGLSRLSGQGELVSYVGRDAFWMGTL